MYFHFDVGANHDGTLPYHPSNERPKVRGVKTRKAGGGGGEELLVKTP